jgi:hypothetical protein
LIVSDTVIDNPPDSLQTGSPVRVVAGQDDRDIAAK